MMVVITSSDLDYGVIFGPIVVQPSILNPSCLIGLMTEDTRNDSSDTRLSLNLLGLSRRSPSLDWLVCIPPARHEEEQNMEAYCKDGGVFYRTLRIIRAGEPLFVWYSKDYCQTLQIPAVRGRGDQDASAFRKVELQNKHPSSNFSAKCLKLSESPDLNLYVQNVSVQDTHLTSVLPKSFPNRTVHAQLPLSQRGSQEVPHSSNMMSVSDPWKQYFLSERLNAGIPYMKNSNPMVEKILQNTSPVAISSPVNAMALSQNWCAKCNASFRMTSDLVYHMRSHHKREFDPVKKKRDDKLRCNICQETFRERHHLTRHMTSHV